MSSKIGHNIVIDPISTTVDPATAKEYRDLLRQFRYKSSSDPIPNLRPWHCKVAVSELLNLGIGIAKSKTEVTIRVLTSTLCNYVYGEENLEQWRAFLGNGGQVRILIYNTEFDAQQSHLFVLAKEFYKGQENIQFKISGTKENEERLSHFMLVGEKGYRLESPHPHDCDKTTFNDFEPEIPARICFNDTTGASSMKSFFERLWELCQPVNF